MSTLILVGGLPGSGKSTLAEILWQGLHATYDTPMIVAADDFFYVGSDEPHCSYEILNDPTLLRGADGLRYRVGRSINPGGSLLYRFEKALQPHAHVWCQEQVRNELARSPNAAVVVHNVFARRWEMEPYFQLAESFGARVTVTRLFDNGCTDEQLARRNSHGVPVEVIRMFRDEWEEDWKNADPTPPWERKSPVGEIDPFGLPEEFPS
jgi:predicted kinase